MGDVSTAEPAGAAADASSSVRAPTLRGYKFEFRPGENSRELVIILSPSRNFILYRHVHARDVVFVSDQRVRYYLLNAAGLAERLLAFADERGYEKIMLTGSSKGAFGALSIARICAGKRPGQFFHVLAFSPQSRLHPPNRAFPYPTYRRMRSLYRSRPKIAQALRRYGDVSLIGDLPNVHATIAHKLGNATDRGEAARISGPNIRKIAIEGSSHDTVICFSMHGASEEEVQSRIDKMYAMREQRDLAASLPKDRTTYTREIIAANRVLPRLDDLFDQVFAEGPSSEPVGALGAALRRWLAFCRVWGWEAAFRLRLARSVVRPPLRPSRARAKVADAAPEAKDSPEIKRKSGRAAAAAP